MFILCSFLPSEMWYFHESGRCRVQTFQFSSSTVRRRMTRRIPACIADIVGDTVGDIAGVEAALLGSFAETTCAAQVLIAHSDALETSWKARRFPVLLSLSGIAVRILNGVKRFRHGGSVVPALPSASGVHVTRVP